MFCEYVDEGVIGNAKAVEKEQQHHLPPLRGPYSRPGVPLPIHALASHMRLVAISSLLPGTSALVDDGVASRDETGVDGAGHWSCNWPGRGIGGTRGCRRDEGGRPRVARGWDG